MQSSQETSNHFLGGTQESRLRSRPGAEDELRALVAVETGCCAWAAWTVEPTAGAVVLDVRSADEGIVTLHTMFR